MHTDNYVPLRREFSTIHESDEKAEIDDTLSAWGHGEPTTWDDLESVFRCVILAEAGAGKTEEFRQQAAALSSKGNPAFFIRIEDIKEDFYTAFEVGTEDEFQTWLQSTEQAWFFLDSVDEARLEHPRTFEKAIRRFAKGLENAAPRAHIYLSSRPYAWRPKEDRRLLDSLLYLAPPPKKESEENGNNNVPQSALSVYIMRPLDKGRIKHFCLAREAENINQLLEDIARANLRSLAERPFDLEGILAKWAEDNTLGSRLELLRHNIGKHLRDDHNTDRLQRQSLNQVQAKEGARRLAAAVILSGKAGINIPDATPVKPGIEAEEVLSDWKPGDVRALLEHGIFNDVIYGAVRFRHREVRELLAAEWFDGLLKNGNSRHSVEALLFREQYGHGIVTPRLRPILPWLILFDDAVRSKGLALQPEIVVEGGDPSQLPLSLRQEILTNIVQRIVSNQDNHSARDNSAIARIANSDLEDDTQQLIREYRDNDDAIFFLGRLVWQGKMVNCAASFLDIAIDSSRGIYARIASVRAVMTCGTEVQKQRLWQNLVERDEEIPRELLAELIQEATPSIETIQYLATLLGKLPPYDKYESIGLSRALHEFVNRLLIASDGQSIAQIVIELHGYLEQEPFIKRRECHVSDEYSWLLSPALHAVERLVSVRSTAALNETALSIMMMVPALQLHYNRYPYISDYKDSLHSLVHLWPELNDALYWASIERARKMLMKTSGELLTDDLAVYPLGHFWRFSEGDLYRLLEYIGSRDLHDDKSVALSTAFRIYSQNDRSEKILACLRNASANDFVLTQKLESLLHPPVSEEMRKYEEEEQQYLQKQDEENEERRATRDTWISELRANPDRICNPAKSEPVDFSHDHCRLMAELEDRGSSTDRFGYANWKKLIPDFGETVANTYRKAAMTHWRHYNPPLRSEGADSTNTPYDLVFGMAGLEIEARESADSPVYLEESEARHAIRYITWELNGFPSWFERINQEHPKLVEEAISKELLWELDNTRPDEPMHYILSDLARYAPWLHEVIAPTIMTWMESSPINSDLNRNYCLRILVSGAIEPARLAELARREIARTSDLDSLAWWYAVLVDCDPQIGIPELEKLLSGLDEEKATHTAEIFVTALRGDSHVRVAGSHIGKYHTAEYLKSLYILIHRHVRVADDDDIERADRVLYTPGLRDNAQEARNSLSNSLAEIPGKASYIAIRQLIDEPPDPDHRAWMAKKAYERAEHDGDLEPWNAKQVSSFEKSQSFIPASHRQLFDLGVNRLKDLKDWLERGNDSPSETWSRATTETEMRRLIAGWLSQQCQEQYTTAQEPEIANSQRMDIWLQNANVPSPVPIELKVLDRNWTGPALCERLRNQLVGDYLREEGATCGVMLLVWQGLTDPKRWVIDGRKVELNGLTHVLECYWQSISFDHSGVDRIEVILLDLTKRKQVSNT